MDTERRARTTNFQAISPRQSGSSLSENDAEMIELIVLDRRLALVRATAPTVSERATPAGSADVQTANRRAPEAPIAACADTRTADVGGVLAAR